ncbi:MAG TPA: hypothetical protein PLQ56_13455 [Aggregatilineales bacterium]|nr:hypothetical protein [Aggregatilineales bacterium]
MQLSEYQWSGNPRGMHTEAAYRPLNHGRYTELQLGWLKLICGGEEYLADVAWALRNNITPMIRIYIERPGAMAMTQSLQSQWAAYRGAGALWFEFYNEPNLPDIEWPAGSVNVSHDNIDGVIRPMMDNWLAFAEYIISLGAYPGFPSLSEVGGPGGSMAWLRSMLGYLRDTHRERFMQVAQRGLWWSVHPYTLNHFYQEVPGNPAQPRDPAQYNALEGGWHFEYPLDPYTQLSDPGRTPLGGSPANPWGDPNGLIAMGQASNQLLLEWFGLGPLPAVGSEGGIYPLPINETQQTDPRYPPYDRRAHAEATAAMFNWIATTAPRWFLGCALWKEDEYYNNQLPAVQRLIEVPQVGPDGIPLRGGVSSSVAFVGPGPMEGTPDYHIVILAPGLSPEWFFGAAQPYWNTFRPSVTTRWDFIDFVPNDRSLAATIIAPPDVAESIQKALKQRYIHIVTDILLARGDLTQIADTLNQRVFAGRRLG